MQSNLFKRKKLADGFKDICCEEIVMRKIYLSLVCALMMCITILSGCGSKAEKSVSATETIKGVETGYVDKKSVDEDSKDLGIENNAEIVTAEEQAIDKEAEDVEVVEEEEAVATLDLEDGVYSAEFNTDSGMFHANEACDGKGTLTVENGVGTFHVSLVSKRVVNLYLGTVDTALEDEGNWLMPTTDEVTYSDGMTDEVYGFDIPVPAINEEFDLALLGEKGKWYDHKVSIDNPEKQ